MRLVDGEGLTFVVAVPDPVAALVLKVMAWNSRKSDKDAFDVWRLLEVCHIVGVCPADFGFGSKKDAANVLRRHFSRPGLAGVRQHAPTVVDRVTALVAQVVGPEP